MKPSSNWKQELTELVSSLRSYVEYQKSIGIKYITITSRNKLKSDKSPVSYQGTSNETPYQNRENLLQKAKEQLGDCKRCKLHIKRKHIVFGSGNPGAKLVFIGEAPGADEDVQGEPFVGKAGQLLTNMIKAIELKRSDVYITNIVKCRPPGNRDPQEDEIDTCLPFLKKQLDIIQPDFICALGRIAAQSLLVTKKSLTQLRGKFHSLGNIKVMATYHPSFLLRYPEKKRGAWEDLQKLQKEYFHD